MILDDLKIAIIGLGYVGLPLAIEFGKTYPTIGFDINADRIAELETGCDSTLEVEPTDFTDAKQLTFSSDLTSIADCNLYIVTVPTPVDSFKQPDLGPLIAASKTVGAVLKQGDIVVYESTVYPGATEEDCVPILERESGLTFNRDFYAGYSPERINPGDKDHRLPDIMKVTSGSTPTIATFVDAVYASIIKAGTFKADSIKVAEAAKVIENTQRDLNIALVNELAIIFNRLDIDTQSVLDAAATKWNFLPFQPGLVGGHCIGVDPYYLTYKAQSIGYHPEVILAGRRINDGMGSYLAGEMMRAMLKKKIQVNGSRLLVMGLTFKENCPDLRNTKVIDMIDNLKECGIQVDVHDPWVDQDLACASYSIDMVAKPETGAYDGVILAVAHDLFKEQGIDAIRNYAKDIHVFLDLKSVYGLADSDLRL